MKAQTLFTLAGKSESVTKRLAKIATICKEQERGEDGHDVHLRIGEYDDAVMFTIDMVHPCYKALHELLRQLIAHEQLKVCDELNNMSLAVGETRSAK